MTAYLNGNRKKERYIFKRVSFSNWQEHERYNYITSGNIEYANDSELKVGGSFTFEGYELPDTADLIRLYYYFVDDFNKEFYRAIATFFPSYSNVKYQDTRDGVMASGKLDAQSVLIDLQRDPVGMPTTFDKNTNVVYAVEQIVKEHGLPVEVEPCSYTLGKSYTFDTGTTRLEICNTLLGFAGYNPLYPNEMGVVQIKSRESIQGNQDYYLFKNDKESIMYPVVEMSNDWQSTPNVIRLIYNTVDACIVGEARNLSGSRSSLDAKGGRVIANAEEVSDLGNGIKVNSMRQLAEQKLREKSCDVEYVTFSHPFVPISLYSPIRIEYSDMEWEGTVENMKVDLSVATKTMTRVKKALTQDIEVYASAEVIR